MSAQPSASRRGQGARRRRSRSAAGRWLPAHGTTCAKKLCICQKDVRGSGLRLTIVGQNHHDVRAHLRRHRRCDGCCGQHHGRQHHSRQHHTAGPKAGHPPTGRGALLRSHWLQQPSSRYLPCCWHRGCSGAAAGHQRNEGHPIEIHPIRRNEFHPPASAPSIHGRSRLPRTRSYRVPY